MSLGYKSSSIIGGPLDDTVIQQLGIRKEIAAKGSDRGDKDIMFLNSTTGWVKMTSSVDEEAGQDAEGNVKYSNLLAQKHILLGGTMSKEKQLGGIFNEADTAYKKYDLLGYRPMAGITGFRVDAKNNFGTLRIAAVDFKVNSVEDLDELEQLFLRPGFSVLLEWGHSLYFDNTKNFQTTINTFGKDFFGQMGSKKIHEEIKKIKTSSSGNYDGMYGVIKNFIWAYNLDGGYDCKVDIVSKGELIESLEMIIAPSSILKYKEDNSYFKESQNKTALHTFLNIIKNAETVKYHKSIKEGTKLPALAKDKIDQALKQGACELYEPFIKNLAASGRKFHVMRAEVGGDIQDEFGQWTRYITLSSLLELINLVFVIKTHDGGLIKFFTGHITNDTTTSFLTFNSHIALDPAIAVLPKPSNGSIAGSTQYYKISEQAEIPYEVDDILNIYVNIDYILKIADSITDEKQPKSKKLYDFLETILEGLNHTLGDINDFDLHFEEDQDMFYIVDRKITPSKEVLKDSFIDVVGLKSMLENVSFASKLSNNISAMMAVAAQAGKSKIGNDMLAMQTWQRGLIDRHNIAKDISADTVTEKETNPLRSNIDLEDQKRLQSFIKKLNTNNSYYIHYNKEDIEGLYPTFRLQMVRYLEFETIEQKMNPAGLIPFELSFTMKGIGGMKIGQAFRIDDRIIPKRYRGNIAFLITGVSHSIKSNRWVTDIKTQMIITNSPSTLGYVTQQNENQLIFSEPFVVGPNPSKRKPIQDYSTSQSGISLIKTSEKFEAKAYVDPGTGNIPITIGYGTTRINGQPVQLGTTITQAQAEAYFKKDLVNFENETKRFIRVDVTQQEFDALVSFTYNVGSGNLQNSTLRSKINSKDYIGAADQFLVWNKADNKVLPGLTKRRAREKQLFLTNNPGNPA